VAVPRKSISVMTTIVILSLQTMGMWGIAAILIVDTATQPSNSLAGAIFLDVLIVLSAAAMVAAVVYFAQGAAATRSTIVVWQMTVIGIGIASAQGAGARWDIALALIIPASVVTIFMLFDREVSRHLARDA
jgi:hypothetical protein